MKLNKNLENKVKKVSLSYLKKGRPDFDVPHTLCTVFWMKKILKKENADEKVLLTAAYFHDAGYSCCSFNKKVSYGQVIENKKAHMKQGSAITKKELSKLKEYSKKDIARISKLVSKHDKLKEIKKREEILLMEADSLGMIDVSRIKPSFGPENWIKFYEDFKRLRVPLFRTKTSREFLKPLLKEAEKYYIKQMELIK